MWELFNTWSINNAYESTIIEYRDIFCMNDNEHVCKVKVKMVHEMIQIQRPIGWNLEKIQSISNDIKRIETYNKASK